MGPTGAAVADPRGAPESVPLQRLLDDSLRPLCPLPRREAPRPRQKRSVRARPPRRLGPRRRRRRTGSHHRQADVFRVGGPHGGAGGGEPSGRRARGAGPRLRGQPRESDRPGRRLLPEPSLQVGGEGFRHVHTRGRTAHVDVKPHLHPPAGKAGDETGGGAGGDGGGGGGPAEPRRRRGVLLCVLRGLDQCPEHLRAVRRGGPVGDASVLLPPGHAADRRPRSALQGRGLYRGAEQQVDADSRVHRHPPGRLE
mmetsp:Transcript_14270/g.36428  ORF Transcript_14270/g.36428 Transcript_14270/m.36428 type:complete len:254 (-) Transcript_14270:261-1022(-)